MRRFERLLAKPLEIWEAEVVGNELHTRSGVAGQLVDHVDKLATASEATAKLDTEIAAKKQLGFVEIKRVAAAELPVRRTELFEWEESDRRLLYQLEQNDRVVTVRDPREPKIAPETKTHATIAAASAAYDREADKYRRLASTVEERAAARVAARTAEGESFDPALEEECVTSNDPKPWSVLADLLQVREHPAGALAAKFDRAVVTSQLPKSDELAISFEAAHGFVRSLHFERVESGETDTHCLAKLVEQCLDLPILRMTHILSFGVEHTIDNSWTSTLAAVAKSPVRKLVRELAFDAWSTNWSEGNQHCYGHDGTHQSCQGYGDFSGLLEELPLLETLEIRSGGMGGTLGEGADLPRLRVFGRHSKGLRGGELLELATLKAPALERLELTFGRRGDTCVDELKKLLKKLRAPKLVHLALREHREPAALVAALAKSPLLKQLRTLDLASTRAGDALVTHAAAFAHLARIEVTSPTRKLRNALPKVVDVKTAIDDDD